MELTAADALTQFNRLNDGIESLYHTIAVEAGLSDSAFLILYIMYSMGGGCRQKDICQSSYTSKQTVNSALRKLTAEGIIAQRPGKGREIQLYLTDTGRRLSEEKIAPVIAAETAVLNRMTSEERQELLRLTEKFLTGMRLQTGR